MRRSQFELRFDLGTIKHLGLQMYSTLPPVIGELIANAWDADARRVDIEPPTGLVHQGTRVTLRGIQRYRPRRISIDELRRGLARRFSVLGPDFIVSINGTALTAEERDMQRLLDIDEEGRPYLWTYEN